MDKEKKEQTKFLYKSTLDRIKELKIQSIKEGRGANKILDDLIDEYLKKVKN